MSMRRNTPRSTPTTPAGVGRHVRPAGVGRHITPAGVVLRVLWAGTVLLWAGSLGGAGGLGPPAAVSSAPPAPVAAASAVASAVLPAAASVPAPAPTASAAAASAPASAPVDLRLIYRTVQLPSGRVDTVYGPRQLVLGGIGPYSFSFIDGRLPVGLLLSPEGVLGGTPTVAGTQRFLLQVHDSSVPQRVTQQVYSLHIGSGKPAPKPAAAASAPASAPQLTALSADDASVPVSRLGLSSVWVYKLSADSLKELTTPEPAPEAETPAGDSPPTPPEPPKAPTIDGGPTAEQLEDMLAPLVDVEFPGRQLFESALEARRCSYYLALANAAAKKQKAVKPTSCTQVEAAASAPARSRTAPLAAGQVATTDLYAQLLPPPLKKRILTLAEQRHPFSAGQAVRWSGGGCGCVTATPGNKVQGIYPFWLANAKTQDIDFSKFTRISYLGGLLNDNGSYTTSPAWKQEGLDFTRAAQRHGTLVDLMVYRRDWTTVLAMSDEQQGAFIRQAAVGLVGMADKPLTDVFSRLKSWLLPFWSEPVYLYDGITLFFDEVPSAPADADKFRRFFRGFVEQLIAEMQKTKRTYALNIVMPDHQLGEDGPYNFSDLLHYVQIAEPEVSKQRADGDKPLETFKYQGKSGSDIAVEYLVLLSEPTSSSKKTLRAKVDDTSAFQGEMRIVFLKRVMPVLLVPTGDVPVAGPPDAASGPANAASGSRSWEQFDSDVSYASWQFSGVGFWPVPTGNTATSKEVSKLLADHYYPGAATKLDTGVCAWICPNRTPARVLFSALLLTLGVSLALYAWSCRVRRIGRLYVAYLWASALLTVIVGFALLSCDPDLHALRTGNAILYALIALLFAGGAYLSLKPRVVLP
ncbi:MAG TPA: hypothetical protein VFL64_21200 [Rhizobacter sp.]|nr:hypothetical protein [Rhizobacter sp.]